MADPNRDRRQYIRHPTSIPIAFAVNQNQKPAGESTPLRNISVGGLSFRSDHQFPNGEVLIIRIDLVDPSFTGEGIVVWCRYEYGHYNVGVQFMDDDTHFRARMVEQICHIEAFRQQELEQKGRRLTSEEAAMEWIKENAHRFPGTGG